MAHYSGHDRHFDKGANTTLGGWIETPLIAHQSYRADKRVMTGMEIIDILLKVENMAETLKCFRALLVVLF